MSSCNLRTCHQSFRFHPQLAVPVHGVYRTCLASEGGGRRRNVATYSTGSLPCPGLSASAPRSLLSHTPMVFRFIIHLVELFAGSVSRHYFVRVYRQTRDGGCCRCWAIDVGSFRWHGAHSAGAEKENYYVAVLVNCMTGGLGGWEDLWCVNIGAFAAGFRDSMSAGTRTCVGTRSYAGAPRHHHSPEQPASTSQRPRPLPSRVFPEHRWATLQKRQFGRAGSNPFQSKLLGDLLIFEAMPFHKSRAGHELHNFFLQLFP